MNQNNCYQLLSPLPLNRQCDSQLIMDQWARFAPGLLPDRVGIHEPLRHKLHPDNMKIIQELWSHHVIFKRTIKPKLEASIFTQIGPHRLHSIWSIQLKNSDAAGVEALTKLLEASAVEISADFGFVHRLMQYDLDEARKCQTVIERSISGRNASLFLTTHTLRRCIPELYWITVFGPPYVRLFTRPRLLSSPAYCVHELANGSILMQISKTPPEEADLYISRKAKIKHHLGKDAFFDSTNPVDFKYRTPVFDWRAVTH